VKLSEKQKDSIVDILNASQPFLLSLDSPALLSLTALEEALSRPQALVIKRLFPKLADMEARRLQNSISYQRFSRFCIVHPEIGVAWNKLSTDLTKRFNLHLVVVSGYRSPAYQALLFLRILFGNNFDYEATTARVKPPEQSRHCHETHHAIDIGDDENPTLLLSNLAPEVTKTINEYGFSIPYAIGTMQMSAEPWHLEYTVPK
jgi:LAS superfamily LD-carboxypeptidase LdcB